MSKRNPPATPAGNAPDPLAALIGSSIQPALITIDGTEHQLGDFVAAAQAASGVSIDDWNKLPGDELDRLIDAAVVEAGGASFLPSTQDPPLPPAEDDGLVHLHGPENCGDVSHGGTVYACKDGKVRVPHEAVAALQAHGFTTVAPARGKAEA